MYNLDKDVINTKKKLLIISSSNFESNLVGANYIRSYFSNSTFTDYRHFRVKTIGAHLSRLTFVFNRLQSFRGISSLLFSYWKKKHLAICLKALENECSKSNCDIVILFLNSPEMIELSYHLNQLFKKNSLKLLVGVWDSFEYLTDNRRLSKSLIQELKIIYIDSLINSDLLILISNGMKVHLEVVVSKFSKTFPKSIILPFPMSKPIEAQRNVDKEDIIEIVFAGSTYCWKEWNHFVNELDRCGWTIGGKKILVHIYGKPNIGSYFHSRRQNIFIHKQQPHSDLIKKISGYSMAYLPYFMSEKKRIVAVTSLPGKMSLYLEAGLPIFYHGPDYSETAKIIRKFNIGVIYGESDSSSFQQCITDIANVSTENITRCYEDFFKVEILRNRLESYIRS